MGILLLSALDAKNLRTTPPGSFSVRVGEGFIPERRNESRHHRRVWRNHFKDVSARNRHSPSPNDPCHLVDTFKGALKAT